MTVQPSTIPDGLRVELSRCKVLPGQSEGADRWMKMLDERSDECIATLDGERMAIEIIFRLKEDGEDYLFWVSVFGADNGGLDYVGADQSRPRHDRQDGKTTGLGRGRTSGLAVA